jgi:hypothetical protein
MTRSNKRAPGQRRLRFWFQVERARPGVPERGRSAKSPTGHRRDPLSFVVIALCFFCACYVGSYYLLVQAGPMEYGIDDRWYKIPHYRYGTDSLGPIYTPLIQLEKRHRPERWSRPAYQEKYKGILVL